MFSEINDSCWSCIENALLPFSQDERSSFLRCSGVFFKKSIVTTASLCASPFTSLLALIEKLALYGHRHFHPEKEKEGFSKILHDSRAWPDVKVLKKDLLNSPLGAINQNFLYGTASCTYQDSGFIHSPSSQWKDWEKKVLEEDNQSHDSAKLFELYQNHPEEVIDRLKKLGVNSYRTSVEWSQIQPTHIGFNIKKMQVYVDFCKLLKKNGIEPMITLHHFSEPKWFHKRGSFENEENIPAFAHFCEYVYRELTQDFENEPLVKYFCTINEPAIEAFSRYVRGSFSPGNVMNFYGAAQFLKGALKAHCEAYKRMKKIRSDDSIKIGFTHQYLKFIPTSTLTIAPARYLTRLINDVTLNVFKTGRFSLQVPLLCNVEETFSKELLQTDFIGVQYYVRPLIGLGGSVTSHPGESMTAMPFREDPAGLYEAITDCYDAFKKPVIVTENGISTHSDEQRNRYMTRALYAAAQAERDLPQGALLGYYQWSFVDNLEWDMGMKPQAFGAFELIEGEISSEPKKGMEILREIREAKEASKICEEAFV